MGMKILFATDGSDHSLLAETLLRRFPGVKGADLRVATVTPTPSVFGGLFQPASGSAYLQDSAELWTSLRDRSRAIAETACDRLEEDGFHPTRLLMDGDPGRELLSLVNADGIDLVVMGSRGENALAAVILGSVARKMLSHSHASVLLARSYRDSTPQQSANRIESKTKLNAVLTTDDSQGSLAAIEFTKSLGLQAFDTLTAFSVEPLIMINTVYDPVITPIEIQPSEADAAQIADKAATALSGSAHTVLSSHDIGRPGSLICDKAHALDADLVIIGASGHGAIDRLLLGSVSYEVATTAPCSVLVVRP